MKFNHSVVGLIYYLHHYTLEQRLQDALAFTGLPLASLLKVLLTTGFVTYGYILVVRRYTRFTISYKVDVVMIVLLVSVTAVNLVLYPRIPFLKLQLITNLFTSVANLSAAASLLPMTRILLHSQKSRVREAHHLWFITFLAASSFAILLLFIDALHKLLTGWMIIYSPLFVLGEIFVGIYMFAIVMLFGPDRYLYWIYYPLRLLTYRKLKRLADRIHREAGLASVYSIPLPRIPTLAVVELAIYRLFILILDSSAQLQPGSELHHRLREIDQRGEPYEETIRQLLDIA